MKLGRKEIGINQPTYFIADIASNHDGDFDRAQRLIYLAAEAGADAVKFQNFRAETLVSDYGFKQLGQLAHQSDWKDGVYDTYKRNELPVEWVARLSIIADSIGIDFLTTPYDIDLLPDLAPHVCAWKIGSGDITYKELLEAASKTQKPIILATGASTEDEIVDALGWIGFDSDIVLLQCNTNYSGDPQNINFANLKVLVGWWGGGIFGLSDHTYNDVTVLGAVALGARVIEKHFTDDNMRNGPDHKFSLNPVTWLHMINRVRELESALGDGRKKVEENEHESRIIQRRALRTTRNIGKGEALQISDLAPLRPCPKDGIAPYNFSSVIGLVVNRDIPKGDYLRREDIP